MAEKGKTLRIAQELKDLIFSGSYPVGSKLASLSVLAKQFSTTVVTMSRAFDLLEKDGLIERINGVGVFVKSRSKHHIVLVFDSKAEMGFFAHKAVFMKNFIGYCRQNGYGYKVFEDVDTVNDCRCVRKYLLENVCDTILISSRIFAVCSEKYLHGLPIAAIGLYAYKDVKTCIHSGCGWIHEACQYLLQSGCSKIAVITNHDPAEQWEDPSISTHEDIYKEMSAAYPDIFTPSLFCQSELSPRGGYVSTCSLLEKLPAHESLGIVVTDAILTHGVISAILQKQYEPGKNLFLISLAWNGFDFSQFSIPVITFQLDIQKDIELIDAMITEYHETRKLRIGHSTVRGKMFIPEGYPPLP